MIETFLSNKTTLKKKQMKKKRKWISKKILSNPFFLLYKDLYGQIPKKSEEYLAILSNIIAN